MGHRERPLRLDHGLMHLEYAADAGTRHISTVGKIEREIADAIEDQGVVQQRSSDGVEAAVQLYDQGIAGGVSGNVHVFLPFGRVLGGGCWAVRVAASRFRKNAGARRFAPTQHKGMVRWAKVFLRVFGVRGGCVVAVGEGLLGGGVTGVCDNDY